MGPCRTLCNPLQSWTQVEDCLEDVDQYKLLKSNYAVPGVLFRPGGQGFINSTTPIVSSWASWEFQVLPWATPSHAQHCYPASA